MTSGKNKPAQYFRAGVGAVITNERGEVLVFERRDTPGSWQLPQGGMEKGEEPIDTIMREIREETNIKQDDLALVREHPDFLTYELPAEYRSKKTGRGQTQKWFLFKYSSDLSGINLPGGGEFISWKWTMFRELLNTVILFRKEIYRKIANEFSEIL